MVRYVYVLTLLLLLPACSLQASRNITNGNDLYSQGYYQTAIYEYKKAELQAPTSAVPNYNSANAYQQLNNIEAVIYQTQEVIKKGQIQVSADAWYNLANAFYEDQQWEAAIEAYKESLRISPGDQDAKHNLEIVLQAYHQQKNENQIYQADQQSTQKTEAGPSENAEKPPDTHDNKIDNHPDSTVDNSMTAEQAIELLETLEGEMRTLQEAVNHARDDTVQESQQYDW